MNALHWAAGRDAKGSVEAAKAVLEAERPLARLRVPHVYGGRATPGGSLASLLGPAPRNAVMLAREPYYSNGWVESGVCMCVFIY